MSATHHHCPCTYILIHHPCRFFFSNCSLDRLDLHSFPTRRSSDLGTVLASWVGTTGAAMLLIRPLLRANRERTDEEHRDRKSTRLNSSHVEISYAVFCLKKKKNSNDNTTSPVTTTEQHGMPQLVSR